MTAKEKIEHIALLQNRINDIMQDLKDKDDLTVIQVVVDRNGFMKLHIYEEDKFAELYPNYDFVVKTNSINNKCLVEVEGVEVFALKPKQSKEETL